MILAWGKKVDAAFRQQLFRVCDALGWNADPLASYLMACMAFESGETFSPSVRNAAGSGATGLIQFMPTTAAGLGTSTTALAAMSAVDQLLYVQKYFKPYASRVTSLSDMYMAILLPSKVGKPGNSELFINGTIAYRQNSGLDSNKDGVVTKLEATRMVQAKLDKGMLPGYALDTAPTAPAVPVTPAPTAPAVPAPIPTTPTDPARDIAVAKYIRGTS